MGRHKEVEMDKLSQDACDALKAGMSYGKYMALKGSTKVTRPTPAPTGYYHVCQHCGKEFYVEDRKTRKFCSDRCRQLSYYVPKIKTATKVCPTCGYDTNAVLDSIDAQPTVDAVEVVRCKDCKKAKEATLCDFICTRDEVMIPMNADDFCSYGERRTDNG